MDFDNEFNDTLLDCELIPPISDSTMIDHPPPPGSPMKSCSTPPPLPTSPDHINLNPPLPSSPINFTAPPLPTQMSNQSNEGLDFVSGDTGKTRRIETPPPLSISPESALQQQRSKKRLEESLNDVEPPAKRVRADSGSGCLALQNIVQNINEELTRCKNQELIGKTWENGSEESLNNEETNRNGEDTFRKSKVPSEFYGIEDRPVKTEDSESILMKIESQDTSMDETDKDTTIDESTLVEGSTGEDNQLNDDEDDDDDNDDDDDDDEYDSDEVVDPEEIDAMLESAIGDLKNNECNEDKTNPPIERTKVVLVEKGHDPFEVLPEGWICVTHMSGMPIYLHKRSRVVSLSKPYFLGPGSIRKHAIPSTAIPCLHYRKALEKEKKEAENADQVSSNDDGSQEIPKDNSTDNRPKIASGIKVETAEQRQKEMLLEPLTLQQYCQKLFHFKTITIQRFKTWKDRREHQYKKKHNLNSDNPESSAPSTSIPSLPQNTKLITCPVLVDHGDKKRKEFVLNPSGKSYVCILHEYAQQSMRVQPKYTFKELENIITPYSATVVLDGVEYGLGLANSKKNAKAEAAKNTLAILMPQLVSTTGEQKEEEKPRDLSFFDQIKMEDPRVFDLCNKAGQPSPYQILLECLQRNYGFGDGTKGIKVEMKNMKHKLSEFTITVGKHTASVQCKNKREGKQLGAQAILQKLHPHINKMGSLLKLYGRDIQRSHTKNVEETRGVTSLQHKASSNRPNYAILNRLQSEMLKLKATQVSKEGTAVIERRELPKSVTIVDM